MATKQSTQADLRIVPPFSPSSDDVESQLIHLEDVIETKARQLDALLLQTYGSTGFRTLAEDVQDRYLWACSDMARDLVEALDKRNTLSAGKVQEVQHG